MSLNQLLELLPDELIGTPTLESSLPNGVTSSGTPGLPGFPGPSTAHSSNREQSDLGFEKQESLRMDMLVSNSAASGNGKDE